MPANDYDSLQVYMAMFGEYLFNITNTSLNNITVEADSPAEFASRRDPEGRRGLQADEYVDYRDGIPYTENFPLADDIDWRNNFNLPELYPDRLVDDPLTPAESQNLYNTIDCSLDEREELRLDGGSSIHPNILIRLSMTFLSATDRGAHACLTLSTQNAMRHFLAAFGMTPCRDRSYICRPALEIIPAPSPPPPDNWVCGNAPRTLLDTPK